jgi:cytochrome P450 family 135
MAMRPLVFMEELRARFGDLFTIQSLHEAPWVMVSDPELIRQVFKAPPDVLHAGEGKEILRSVLGENSVLLLDEDRHMEQRKLLLPPFSGKRVGRHEEAMRTAAERALEAWPLGKEAPSMTWTHAIALEVILRAVFGVSDGERLGPLRDALRELPRPKNVTRSEEPSFREAIDRVDALVFAEIADRASEAGGDDILSLLLQARHEDGSPMSRIEIRDELMSLLMAGYETTGATLAWTLERLARHPAALALTEEEATAGGGPYTDAVIKETLRLRPALPIVARAVKAPFPLGEYVIPPSAKIMPAILLLHHRPDVYPDPASFRPERFLDSPPDPNAWIPFGGGVRRCIGARFALHEMRVVLSVLLTHVTVRAVEPEAEAMRNRSVTLTPVRGGRVILERR